MGNFDIEEILNDPCAYCGAKATQYAQYLSGEPVPLCDAGDCHDRFNESADSELDEFKELGLV